MQLSHGPFVSDADYGAAAAAAAVTTSGWYLIMYYDGGEKFETFFCVVFNLGCIRVEIKKRMEKKEKRIPYVRHDKSNGYVLIM